MALNTYDEVFPGQTSVREYLDNQPADGPLNDTESYFTGQQREWLLLYLRQCADLLGLHNWTLRVWHESPADEAHASVMATTGRLFASFRFDNFLFEQDVEVARNHVAHELCHVLYEGPTQMVEHDLKGQLSDSALSIFLAGYRRQMEFATDHLATLLARLLPPVPWASAPMEVRTAKANVTAQERFKEERTRPPVPDETPIIYNGQVDAAPTIQQPDLPAVAD